MPVDWDDVLHIAVEYAAVDGTGAQDGSNGLAARASFPEERTIRVWQAQMAVSGASATYSYGKQTRLYDTVANVAFFMAFFPNTPVGGVGSISIPGTPMAAYILPATNSLGCMPATVSAPTTQMAAGIVFSAEAKLSTVDFAGRVNCGVALAGSVGLAVINSYAEVRRIRVWKVNFASNSAGAAGGDVYNLSDAVAAVVIYSAVAPAVAAGGTTALIGASLASYILPIGNTIQSAWVSGTGALGCAFVFTAEPWQT